MKFVYKSHKNQGSPFSKTNVTRIQMLDVREKLRRFTKSCVSDGFLYVKPVFFFILSLPTQTPSITPLKKKN